MAEIVNLRQFRKARERAEKEVKAADNRIAFGRPKKARTLQERKKAIEVSRHEGHKLEGHKLEGHRPVGPDRDT